MSFADRINRITPSATLEISAIAGSLIFALSFSAMIEKYLASVVESTRRKSKRWQREIIVIGIFLTSVVAKINFTCAGGSSSVFS